MADLLDTTLLQDTTCRPSAGPCDAPDFIPSLSAVSDTKEPDDKFYGSPRILAKPRQVPMRYVTRLPRPQVGTVPYGEVIKSCVVPGAIALTFDDGPSKYTNDLLDLLEREHVRATFFVCGGNLDSDQITGHGHPALLRRMVTSGHQIGSHTWDHPDLATTDEEDTFTTMFTNEQAMLSVLGVVPTYMRPPYLSTSNEALDVMDELGYHVVNLDLDTNDWEGDNNAAEENYLDGLESSDSKRASHIVLAHDTHEQTAHEFAEFMIEEGKASGYRFVTVGECLGDPVHNWYRNPYNGGSWLQKSKKTTANIERRGESDGCIIDDYSLGNMIRCGPWDRQMLVHTVAFSSLAVLVVAIIMSLIFVD